MDRSLLSRATDGTDAPTPGYLYLDIAKNAASSPAACSEVSTYLTRRLASKNSPNIKFKCLKVIAKTAESPVTRGQFKRAVTQDPAAVAAIKEALQFRGPPDPARGDEPYTRVRDAAKEALDAIYSDTPSSAEYPPTSGLAPSYGASPYSSGPAPPGPPGSSRRMEGIGNPMFKDPRLDQQTDNLTLGKAVSTAGETIVAMIKDPLARNVPDGPPPSSTSGMQGYGSGGAYGRPPPGRSQLASSTNGQWTMASNRGPNAIGGAAQQNSEYYRAQSRGSQWGQHSATAGTTGGVRGGVGGSWASGPAPVNPTRPSVALQAREAPYSTPSITLTHSSNPAGSGGTAASDGTYERNLIMELCPPGGMKAEPPPEKLANFARSVPSLNPDLVCPALLDSLEEGQPWIIRAKALCVMETIIRVALEQAEDSPMNAYVDFFHACSAEIEPLAGHPRAAIKEPAKRVLRALGVEPTTGSLTAAPASRPPPPSGEAPNLLDFDEPKPVVAPPTAAPPTTAPPAAPEPSSLFGGLKVQASMETENSPVAARPAPSEGFSGLLGNVQDASRVEPSPGAQAPSTPSGDLFGNMTIKDGKPGNVEAKEAVSAAPPAGGSAFGFLNESAPSTPSEAQPPSKEAFDPLMNMSPNTAKKVGSIPSPQMQAMAYQMMLQQQQLQMQQMQMALAMQQQGGRPLMQVSARQGSNPNVMAAHPNTPASNSFSFLDAPSTKKEDKTFDFVKDAMKDEGGKK